MTAGPRRTVHDASIERTIAAVVETDPEIRDEVRGLVKDLIGHAKHTMRWGQPGEKTALMRAALPAMMRALQRAEQSENEQVQREAYGRMMNQIRDEVAEQVAKATHHDSA